MLCLEISKCEHSQVVQLYLISLNVSIVIESVSEQAFQVFIDIIVNN